MKALVIGATGFIGHHIVNELISKGIQVKVLLRSTSDITHLAKKPVELAYGNIFDLNSLNEHTKNVDLIFSAFGILGQWNIPDQDYWEANTEAIKRILASCRNNNIKQFIHISSAGVLGPLPDGVAADESYPHNPSNIYERTKCEAEKEVLHYGETEGIPFTIIRPEFVYGPGDTHVLGLFRAIKTKRFVLLGNGQSYLHPTYIDDLIHGISRCIANQSAVGKTYLITGPRPYTVKELAMIIAEELGVRLLNIAIPLVLAHAAAKVLEFGARAARFEPPLTKTRVRFFTENRAFSNQKAQAELKYDPKVDFREGVRRTIRWYRDNGYL
jgi:nucleoside-diphosphate-sugar epimerase